MAVVLAVPSSLDKVFEEFPLGVYLQLVAAPLGRQELAQGGIGLLHAGTVEVIPRHDLIGINAYLFVLIIYLQVFQTTFYLTPAVAGREGGYKIGDAVLLLWLLCDANACHPQKPYGQ